MNRKNIWLTFGIIMVFALNGIISASILLTYKPSKRYYVDSDNFQFIIDNPITINNTIICNHTIPEPEPIEDPEIFTMPRTYWVFTLGVDKSLSVLNCSLHHTNWLILTINETHTYTQFKWVLSDSMCGDFVLSSLVRTWSIQISGNYTFGFYSYDEQPNDVLVSIEILIGDE